MSMSPVVVGTQSRKFILSNLVEAIPFSGMYMENDTWKHVIGITSITDATASVWETPSNLVLQSWRSVLILELVSEIKGNTINACWYLADPESADYELNLTKVLKVYNGTLKELKEKLEAIYNSVPTTEELNEIITKLTEKGLEIEAYELENAVRENQIEATPVIKSLIDKMYKDLGYKKQEPKTWNFDSFLKFIKLR